MKHMLYIFIACTLLPTYNIYTERLLPHQENNCFYNAAGEQTTHNTHWGKEIWLYTVGVLQRAFSMDSRNPHFSDKDSWIDQTSKMIPNSDQPYITWIGHSTFLIQVGGLNIITDPIFGNALSLLYNRILPPGIPLDKLPDIDLVLVSHNHHDHTHKPSLQQLNKDHAPHYFVPQNSKKWYKQNGMHTVTEHMWWDSYEITTPTEKKITITFLPAHHWSQRRFFYDRDKNHTLWGSWMIEYDGKRIYFAGDTAYGDHFKDIQQEFGSIDVALLPIGPCERRCWMHATHMGAEEAGQAILDLNAQHLIPMHWGTFYFGIDHFTTPIERLALWWGTHHETTNKKTLHLAKMGKTIAL